MKTKSYEYPVSEAGEQNHALYMLLNEILERLESLERRCDWYDNNGPWNETAR